MPDYTAPAHLHAAAAEALRATHPTITEAYLAERATVVAAFAEAANFRVVPDDHPVAPSVRDGVVPAGVVLPPPPCCCAHCGKPVEEGNRAALHTVAGTTLQVTVSHCDDCHQATAECALACQPLA